MQNTMSPSRLIACLMFSFFSSFFSQTGELHSQPIKLTLKKTSQLSQEYHHWFADTANIQFTVGNSSPQRFIGLCKFRVSESEGNNALFGNNLPDDSIVVNANSASRFYLKDVLKYPNLLMDESFYSHFNKYSKIPSGQYKFHLEIIDTNNISRAADSFLFWIDSISAPVNYYPLNSTVVHQSHFGRIHFGYSNFDKKKFPGLRYIFKMWKRDSITDNLSFQDSNPSFMDTTIHPYHYRIPSGKYNLIANKFYYWQVECRTNTWNPLGLNKGRSDLFFFTTSNDSTLLSCGFYADTSNPWATNNLQGTPTPPDPLYCEIFTGFETGNLQQNRWISYKGEITPGNRRNGQIFSPNDNARFDFAGIWQGGFNNDLQALAPPNDGRFGNKCAQLGALSSDFNRSSVSIRKTWTVSPATKQIKIWYALVSEGADEHDAMEEDYWKKNFFQVSIYKGSTIDKNNVVGEPLINHSGKNNYWNDCWDLLGPASNSRKRVKWICKTLNLDAYLNSTVTIDVLVASCMPGVTNRGGNHKTMAWVDFCVTEGTESIITMNKQRFCKNETITASGAMSKYEKNHRWELWKLDQISNPASLIFSDESGCYKSPGSINITNILANKGISPECNDKFRLILLTNDNCSNWDTAFKDITITCPDVKGLSSGPYCCKNWDCSLVLGQPAKSGFKYRWSGPGSNNCLSATNIAQPTFKCGNLNPNCSVISGPVIYWMHVIDTNNCADSLAVVINSSPIKAKIDVDSVSCSLKLCGSATTIGYESFQYNWTRMGNNTLRENVRCFYHNPTKKETWRLIISNSCGPDTVFATIDTLKAFKGPIDTLVMPSYLCDATNYEWVVNYLNRKNPNSRYNINEYKLSMITRWGGVNLLAWEKSNSGFTQGHIKITKEQLGKFASLGHTNFILLEMRNCDPRNNKLYFSNDPYKIIFTRPNKCEVCVGDQKIKLIRAWYKTHEQGGQNVCYNLVSGGNYCNVSDWRHSSVCTRADKKSKLQGANLQKNCICEHKVWSWLWESKCDPATYKEVGLYDVKRNVRNVIPVIFER
jgi:hypothetical protein